MTEKILVVGKENCSRCDMVKNIFKENNVNFEYVKFEELSQEKQKEYRKLAILKKQLEMPLILLNNTLIDYKEVL